MCTSHYENFHPTNIISCTVCVVHTYIALVLLTCCFLEALIFGKTNASPAITRNQSIGMEWSDSDSSIDSMPDSDSDLEGDWPEQTGFMVCVCVCVCTRNHVGWLVHEYIGSLVSYIHSHINLSLYYTVSRLEEASCHHLQN